MKTSTRSHAVVASSIVALLACPHAFADPSAADWDSAKTLYNEGRAIESSDPKGAVAKFKAAHEVIATPIIDLELGKTQITLGQLLDARETLLGIARIPIEKNESKKSSDARVEAGKLADDLKARIPSLTITVTDVPNGATATVTIDGAPISAAALLAPRKVDPGKHTLVAKAGSAEKKIELELKEGETKEVKLSLAPEVAPSTPIPTASPSTTPVSTPSSPPVDTSPSNETKIPMLTWIGGGVAGAGLLVGTITGVMTLSKASTVKSHCANNQCGPDDHSTLDSAHTLGTISTISFVVAGAGAVAAVVGLLTNHPSTEKPNAASITPWIGLGAAGVGGNF